MFTHRTDFRKNTVDQWYPTDSKENYKPFQHDGRRNYTVEDIDYKFNSEGFRCDEFTLPSDLPILFMGCSFTEGIGLPLQHIWPKFLIDIIHQQPGLENANIPHHSIALGGTGVDSAAYFLPKFAEITKPKFIVGYFSGLFRRDYCTVDLHVQQWLHADTPSPYYRTEINKLFSDPSFALHQAYRSLQTIDLVAQLHGAKAIVLIDHRRGDLEIPKDLFSSTLIKQFNVGGFVYPPYLEDTLTFARDSMHHGAKWQHTLATYAADEIIPHINPSYCQTVRPPYDPHMCHHIYFKGSIRHTNR